MLKRLKAWWSREQAWRRFKSLPDGHPEKFVAAMHVGFGERAAEVARRLRSDTPSDDLEGLLQQIEIDVLRRENKKLRPTTDREE